MIDIFKRFADILFGLTTLIFNLFTEIIIFAFYALFFNPDHTFSLGHNRVERILDAVNDVIESWSGE